MRGRPLLPRRRGSHPSPGQSIGWAAIALALLTLAVACGGGTTSGSTGPTGPAGSASTLPALPPPSSPDGTTAAAGTAADDPSTWPPKIEVTGPPTYDVVAPPAGSPIRAVRRDCPHSVRLSDERTLWVFCDTSFYPPVGPFLWFVNTTAALSTPDAPLTLHEALDDKDQPQPFLVSPSPDTCGPDLTRLLWPTAAVDAPTGGEHDRILIYFWAVCVRSGQLEPVSLQDVGVAELRYDPAAPPALDAPLRATVLNEHLWPAEGDFPSYGRTAVAHDGFVHTYRCPTTQRYTHVCFVGRVAPDDASRPDAYRYWDGSTWQPDIAAAAPVSLPLGGFSIQPMVEWVDALGLFVMAHDFPDNADLGLRVARRPEGPWSEFARVPLQGCDKGFPESCFAFEVQDQLSDATSVGVTWFDGGAPHDGIPTRFARIPIHITPAAPLTPVPDSVPIPIVTEAPAA